MELGKLTLWYKGKTDELLGWRVQETETTTATLWKEKGNSFVQLLSMIH